MDEHERIEELEKGVKKVIVLNKQLEELDKHKSRVKEKEMELLTLKIKNKENEIRQIKKDASPVIRTKYGRLPRGTIDKDTGKPLKEVE